LKQNFEMEFWFEISSFYGQIFWSSHSALKPKNHFKSNFTILCRL
jgi:hypothetical protein